MSAQYPNQIASFRSVENRPGVEYDSDDTKTLFAEDITKINDEVQAVQTALGANLVNVGVNGWLPLGVVPVLTTDDDPIFAVTFSVNISNYLTVGNKVKFTQHGSTKYFIIVKIDAYGEGEQVVYLYGGTDYSVENTTTYPITSFNFSLAKIPFGFPADPTKWLVKFTDASTLRSQATPTQNVWYNPGSISLDIPIGIWDVYYEATIQVNENANASPQIQASLSDSNNSVSDNDFTCTSHNSTLASVQPASSAFTRRKFLNISTKTTHYLIIRTLTASVDYIYVRSDLVPTNIYLICAFL